MAEKTLVKEWQSYGDFTRPPSSQNFDEPIDMSLPLKVYTVPGCSACMRTKEFLTKHNVKFISVNAFEDKQAFEELAKIGVKRIPIAARGKHWADGQILRDLARVAGIKLEKEIKLSPEELAERSNKVMSAARNLAGRIPQDELSVLLPGRPRSYKQLCVHIFQIFEMYLELVEENKRFEFLSYLRDVPVDVTTVADVQRFGGEMQTRFNKWWQRAGRMADFNAKADVYYGEVSLHHFFERTVWHSAHHTRQLQRIVQQLGFSVANGLKPEDLDGLPLPEGEYDDKVKLS